MEKNMQILIQNIMTKVGSNELIFQQNYYQPTLSIHLNVMQWKQKVLLQFKYSKWIFLWTHKIINIIY